MIKYRIASADINPTLAIILGVTHNQQETIDYFYNHFEHVIDWLSCVKVICKHGKWDLFDRITHHERNSAFWNLALYGSAIGYQCDRIDDICSQGALGQYAFYGACEGNHLDLVKRYDKKYTNINYGSGMVLASEHEDISIVIYILDEHYIDDRDYRDLRYLNICLGIACKTDNMPLLNKLMSRGANDYALGLSKSCGKENGMSSLMISYGALSGEVRYCTTCNTDHKNV